MQDFLAGGATDAREGDYCELQVGPAPTQMQTFPLPGGETIEWTEFFKAYTDTSATLTGDYGAALDSLNGWLAAEGTTRETVDKMDSFFSAHADDAPSGILAKGMPWGGLEEKRRGQKLAPGCSFSTETGDELQGLEVRPWVELLEEGTFSGETLARAAPLSYQVSDAWVDALEAVAPAAKTWLHLLFLGGE